MEKYDSGVNVCPHCGYDDRTPYDPMYITPGTILRDRYLVGVLIENNGEGASYTGYDISTECRVLIREYMPINLCTRVKDKATISVNYNNLAKYKAFMAEYTELNKSLARLRNDSNINPVLDMFAENNTTYTIFEHIEGVKMLDYLKENAGELSWDQVSRLFPPLFTTIGRLHNAGIIHRAISPDTVYMTNKGELRLTGFCISPVRTANAGLEYELFKGYAAPEQYSASISSRQGSWTDVYGICALIYRSLTGCMPVDSTSRLNHDDLCEPHMLNAHIPRHVSRVIMEGMNLNVRDRIQTITELVTRLFEQPPVIRNAAPVPPPEQPVNNGGYNQYPQNNAPDMYQQPMNGAPDMYQQPPYPNNMPPQGYNNYPQYPNNNGYYEDEDYRYEKVNTVDRIKVPVIIAILLMAILMIIIVVIYNILHDPARDDSTSNKAATTVSDNVVSGTTDASTEASTEVQDTEVPVLVGKFFSHEKDKWKDYFTLDPTYEYNNEYPESDRIISQEIDAGTMISKGTVIKVKVSKGPESSVIPDYAGLTVEQYKSRLEEAGISDFNYQFIPANIYYGVPDSIVELQVDGNRVAPGTYFSNKENKKLTVYYLDAKAQVYNEPETQSEEQQEQEQETQQQETSTEEQQPDNNNQQQPDDQEEQQRKQLEEDQRRQQEEQQQQQQEEQQRLQEEQQRIQQEQQAQQAQQQQN